MVNDALFLHEFFSVVVKEDKKLLTVLFPDGRDGRAFTLKVPLFVIAFFLFYSFISFYYLSSSLD